MSTHVASSRHRQTIPDVEDDCAISTELSGRVLTYLNNAATSYPKPPSVVRAVRGALIRPPREPGRVGQGKDPAETCRQELAQLLGVLDPRQIILTPSATYALNLAIGGMGVQHHGGHLITTRLEHNSVLRPLAHLRQRGHWRVTCLRPQADGRIPPESVRAALRARTRLIAVTHASNVTGSIQPVEEIAAVAAEAGVPLLIDASQSTGVVDWNYSRLPGRVLVAFAGHKGLMGPTGIGGLIVPDATLPQLWVGGTGIHGQRLLHPPELPLRHEAGTNNYLGIAGLTAGVRFVRKRGVQQLGQQRHALVELLRQQLREVESCCLTPLAQEDGRAGIVSFTLAGWTPAEVGFVLRDSFQIETRWGLHCAPLIHAGLGTSPQGCVRVSVAAFNTPDDVLRLARAVRSLVRRLCTT